MEKQAENAVLHTPKEVAAKLGITPGLLNKWVQFFEIETEWSKENKTGHRRYTNEHIRVLVSVKEKVQEMNWSWDKTKAWLSGDETVNQEIKTGLEAKMDLVLKKLEQQESFNKDLLFALKALQQENTDLKTFILNTKTNIEAPKEEISALEITENEEIQEKVEEIKEIELKKEEKEEKTTSKMTNLDKIKAFFSFSNEKEKKKA